MCTFIEIDKTNIKDKKFAETAVISKLIKPAKPIVKYTAQIDVNKIANTHLTLLKELKDLLIFKVCIDTNNNLLSIRCAIKFKNYAWDLLAATSKEGRKNYSSYQVTYEVLKECVKKNVAYYDLSGINKKLNKGVYNFKKGTGSIEYEKLGLWQYNRYTLLNKFLSNFIN